MSKFTGLQKFHSDASKCVTEGNGLKKAFRGKQATFTVDTSQAGKSHSINYSYYEHYKQAIQFFIFA